MSATVMRRLLSLALRERRTLYFATACILAAALAEMGAPLLIRVFIDDHVGKSSYETRALWALASAYVLLQLLSALAAYAQGLLLARIALSAVAELRRQAFDTALRLPMAWFDRTPVGVIVSRLSNDTEAVKDFYVNVLGAVVANSARVIGMAVAMIVLDWRMAIPCLVFVPATLCVMAVYQNLSGTRFRAVRQALASINANLSETIAGLRAVQLMRRQQIFCDRFRAMAERHYAARMSSLRLDAMLLRPLIDLLLLCCTAALVMWFGGRALEGNVEIGVIYVFVNYLGRFAEPIIDITHRLSLLQNAMVSAQRVFEIIDRDDARAPLPRGREPEHMLLRVHRLWFGYERDKPVLQDISFELEAGGMLALVGATGSGKSTLAGLLLRFHSPQRGEITLGEVALQNIADQRFGVLVSYVPQDPFLLSASIAENIDFGLGAERRKIVEAADRVGLGPLLRRLPAGIDTPVGERGGSLSAGQRQQVTLARALLREPAIVILDEATASVDSESEAVFQQSLARLKGSVSMIVIAHRLSTLREADEIIVLAGGRILERGSHGRLIANQGLYRRLWELSRIDEEALA